MVDMKNSRSWAWGFRCYEQLMVVDDMSHYGSYTQAFKGYKQLRVIVNMNDSKS